MMFSLPQNADMLRAGQVPKGMFSSMSNVSRDRLVNEAVDRVGTHVLDAVRQWAVLHGIEFGTLCVDGRVTTVMATMLAPHAHLVASGRWGQWAFPVLVGHPSGGLGIALVEHWLHGHRRPVEDELLAMLAELQWGASGLAIIADTLRAHLPAGEVGGDTLAVLRWLESRRDHIVKSESLQTQQAFHMHELVDCLLYAGFLSSMDSMTKSLQRALRVVVKDPVLLEHLNNQLATRVAPSSTTLRRHRLTLYMAYNLILADATDQRLRGGGLVRWGTVDASPQGGIDWLMTGGRTVGVDQLIDAFRAANMLWNSVVRPWSSSRRPCCL